MTNYRPDVRILVLRLSSLGDIILTAPVYKNLREKWPDSHIAVLTKPKYARAIKGHPSISEVISFNGLRNTLKEIRKRNFTHLLDLHATPRTRILSAMSGIPRRVRYRKDTLARRLFVRFKFPHSSLQRHTMDRYLDSLSAFDVPVLFRSPQLSDWRFDHEHEAGRSMIPGPGPSRICVLQTAFMGDAILTLPLLRKIKILMPRSKTIVVCGPESRDIFLTCPQVDDVIIDDKRSSGFFPALLKLVRRLRAYRFDVAILPHRSMRSALSAFLARIPVRVGFHSSPGRLFLNRKVPFSWMLHDVERNLTLLGPFSKAPITHPPGLSSRQSVSVKADIAGRLQNQGVPGGKKLVGVHPGSVWRSKRWLPERYAGVIQRLTGEFGVRTILIGGAPDIEWNASVAELSGVECLDWTGKTTIDELMALMKHLKLFITNDSGPMHVATAFNVPTLAIFGPTTRELGFFPYGQGHRVLEADLRCRPCGLHGGKNCPRGHFLCMNLISMDTVCKTAVEMMKKNG